MKSNLFGCVLGELKALGKDIEFALLGVSKRLERSSRKEKYTILLLSVGADILLHGGAVTVSTLSVILLYKFLVGVMGFTLPAKIWEAFKEWCSDSYSVAQAFNKKPLPETPAVIVL